MAAVLWAELRSAHHAGVQALGVPEVQIQEPILTLSDTAGLEADFQATFAAFAEVGVPINLVALYDDIGDAFSWATKLPVQVRHPILHP